MDSQRRSTGGKVTLVRQRRTPLRALRDLWWSRDRRRRIAQLSTKERRQRLDESYVVDAMARQIEELRNLPEVAPWS